jgi:cyclohexanone monooxygenase
LAPPFQPARLVFALALFRAYGKRRNIVEIRTAADFVAARIRETVKDPRIAETLVPRDIPIGAKRICLDTNYFETFNRPNVTLVDLAAEPIAEITAHGIRAGDRLHEVDFIIFATGFDAVTGALLRIDIRGLKQLSLAEKWAEGPSTYLGLMTAGFPNLFMITGPGSPSVVANVVMAIEQHVEFIADCLAYMRSHGFAEIEADAAAEEGWVRVVDEAARKTVYSLVKSWYNGANIPGKPQRFLPYFGGVTPYREACDASAAAGYRGFHLTAAPAPTATTLA